jgi:hypothetical protein
MQTGSMVLLVIIIACCEMALFGIGFFVLERRFRQMEQLIERQQRLIEGLSALAITAPHPGTARLERRITDVPPGTGSHRRENSPLGTRTAEPSPRSTQRLSEPSPRSTQRLAELSPRSSKRLEPSARTATSQQLTTLPDITAVHPGQPWEASHRIIFTPDQGRAESWLVMMLAAPGGGRLATTKSEWTAGVAPAWHCTPAGSWSYHGKPTPEGSRGRVSVEIFTMS